METPVPGYSHTQKAPLCLIVYAAAVWLFVGAWLVQGEPVVALVLVGGAVLMALLASAFHYLTIEDGGEHLAIRFGPLPVFHRRVRYADIERVEIGRTLILEGWGIHMSVRGGWVWNLWGRDCVVVHLLRKGVLRIGTNDAANLARFLQGKIDQQRDVGVG
jgi:hypothetical protein